MGNELMKVDAQAARVDNEPMSIDKLVSRSMLIQQAMGAVMKDGEHYGKIPGCGEKPTLLKAGAEKLTTLFRLSPEFGVDSIDLGGGHREYRVKCRMLAADGSFLGEGCGSAATTESKWRYRSELTNNEVPKAYWDTRNPALLGGPTFSPRKITDKTTGKQKWLISQRVEHSDPADYYNTCLKMAVKRAHVAAALTVTSASDIFAQDLDDLERKAEAMEAESTEATSESQQPVRGRPRSKSQTETQAPPAQPPQQATRAFEPQPPRNATTPANPPQPSGSVSPETPVTEDMRRGIFAELAKSNKTKEQLEEHLFGMYGVATTKDITYGIFHELLEWIKNGKAPKAD